MPRRAFNPDGISILRVSRSRRGDARLQFTPEHETVAFIPVHYETLYDVEPLSGMIGPNTRIYLAVVDPDLSGGTPDLEGKRLYISIDVKQKQVMYTVVGPVIEVQHNPTDDEILGKVLGVTGMANITSNGIEIDYTPHRLYSTRAEAEKDLKEAVEKANRHLEQLKKAGLKAQLKTNGRIEEIEAWITTNYPYTHYI